MVPGTSRLTGVPGTGLKTGKMEKRPVTGVIGTGYKAPGTARNGGRGAGFIAVEQAEFGREDNAINQAKDKEKKVNALLEESTELALNGSAVKALEKAKEAAKQESALYLYREKHGHGDDNNPDLTYSVTLQLALVYQKNGQHDDALNQYNKIVKNKDYVQAGRLRVNMGNIYFELGEYESANKMYKMALDQVPTKHKELKAKVQSNIGNALVKLGQYQEAVEAYEQVLDMSNTAIEAAFNLLVCYYALGEPGQMKKTFARLLGIRPFGLDPDLDLLPEDDEENADPDSPEAFLKKDTLSAKIRALRAQIVSRIVTSAKLISPVIESDWETGYDTLIGLLKSSVYTDVVAELEMSKAMTYLRLKDFDAAIEALKAFEKQDGDMVSTAANNLSFLYFLEKDYANALKYARRALGANRYNAKAIVNEGNCSFVSGDLKTAAAMYKRALGVEADCVEAMYNLGLTQRKLGDGDGALATFDKLHSIVPSSPEIAFQLATLYEAKGELHKSAQVFNVLTGLVPTDPGMLARLGSVQASIGDEAAGLQAHSEAARYYPVDMDTLAWLGTYHINRGGFDKATEFFKRASRVKPYEAKWTLMVAHCHRKAGLVDDALRVYQDVESRFLDDPEALNHVLKAYQDLGRTERVADVAAALKRAQSKAAAKAAAGGGRGGATKGAGSDAPENLKFSAESDVSSGGTGYGASSGTMRAGAPSGGGGNKGSSSVSWEGVTVNSSNGIAVGGGSGGSLGVGHGGSNAPQDMGMSSPLAKREFGEAPPVHDPILGAAALEKLPDNRPAPKIAGSKKDDDDWGDDPLGDDLLPM